MSSSFRRFDYLSWPEASKAAKTPGSTLIWPLGACEQHGPHLPLCTDSFFAERISNAVLEQLPETFPIWTLPPQHFGFSPEHASFPGTVTLSANLLLQLIKEVGEDMASMGFSRFLLFNAHGGQIGLLESAARELRLECPSMGVLPCFLWRGVEGLSDLISKDEIETGLHAGLAETSLMLSLQQDLVSDERPVDGDHSSSDSACTPPMGWSLEGASPYAWMTKDVSDSGVIGDSRMADSLIGSKLENVLTKHWKKLLTSLMKSNWPPVNTSKL